MAKSEEVSVEFSGADAELLTEENGELSRIVPASQTCTSAINFLMHVEVLADVTDSAERTQSLIDLIATN